MIEITNLRKEYPVPGGGSVTAMHVERMAVAAGEQIAVVGPSGCGKTTFLSVLGCILPATSGGMRWDGEAWGLTTRKMPARLRARKVGFVFQELNLIPSLTLAENLAAAGSFLGIDNGGADSGVKAVMRQLEKVRLGDKAKRKPGELSRGERQRAAIARVMLHPHPLVIADEPTASLDEENAALAMDLLCAMAKENNSALVVATHDPRVMERLEKRVEFHPAHAMEKHGEERA